MISWQQLADGWDWFFHAPEPVAALCVFRVLLGLILVVNALLLLAPARALFGPSGVFPSAVYARHYGRSRLTLLNLLPDQAATLDWIVRVHLAAAVLLTIGLWTNVSAAVAWLTLVSLHHRNPPALQGGDTVMRLMLLLLCFSPAGAALSVDAWLAGHDPIAALHQTAGSPWALRLMQIQVAIIYVKTALWKIRGRTWRNGTAVFYAVENASFQRWPLPRWFLRPSLIKVATYGTLALELALGTLIWIEELRYPVLLAGILLHLALEYSLNLQLFGWVMCACLLLFVDPGQMANAIASLCGAR